MKWIYLFLIKKRVIFSNKSRVSIEFEDGSTYQGYFNPEKKQLQHFGNLKIRNQTWQADYEGHFHKNLFHKSGILRVGNDYFYEGEFKKNYRHGFGKEKVGNDFIYEGQFSRGKKKGQGKLITKSHIIKGVFNKNRVSGVSEIIFLASKSVFRGFLKNSEKTQYGKYLFQDGRYYEGEYSNDQKSGFGIFNYSDGRVFEGMWQDGYQSGFGVYQDIDSFKFLGVWMKGKMVFSFLME